MALASVVPKSDFGYVTRPQKESLMVQAYQRKDVGAMADVPDQTYLENKIHCSGPMNDFYDMFLEPFMKSESTEILNFMIDMGESPPIKQSPYQVLLTEGDVKEAVLGEYASFEQPVGQASTDD
ncbi:hypothetical protein PInf_005612 [Phytophthora infestans]|nr:hypothetical protein PInf_005612 [Phytophthora infestans]